MALGAAAKDPSWTLHAVCLYCVRRMVESSAPAGDDASRHPIAAAVVHVRIVRIAPAARHSGGVRPGGCLGARVSRPWSPDQGASPLSFCASPDLGGPSR